MAIFFINCIVAGKLFKGGNYLREETICGIAVFPTEGTLIANHVFGWLNSFNFTATLGLFCSPDTATNSETVNPDFLKVIKLFLTKKNDK